MSDFEFSDFDPDLLDEIDNAYQQAVVPELRPARRRRQPTPYQRGPSFSPPLNPNPPALPAVISPRRNRRARNADAPVVIQGGGGARARRDRGQAEVIDLAGEESDDEEVVFLHQNPIVRPRPPATRPQRHRAPIPAAEQRDGERLAQRFEFEAAIAPAAQQRAQDIANAEMEARDALRRAPDSPPPPAQQHVAPGPQRRIGFGGAALMNAGQNVLRYIRPARPAAPPIPPPPAPAADDVPAMPNFGDMGFAALNALYAAPNRIPRLIDPQRHYNAVAAAINYNRAGPAVPPVNNIIDQIPIPTHPAPAEPFTQNFEITDIADKAIELDHEGRVVRDSLSRKRRKVSPKPYLACANCPEPLRLSGAYRSSEDRVWALRCGHVIDGRCLTRLSTPSTEEEMKGVVKFPPGGLDVLGGAEGKKGRGGKRGGKAKKTEVRKPDEYAWFCPVKGCGLEHRSVKHLEGWEQKEAEGAVTVYM